TTVTLAPSDVGTMPADVAGAAAMSPDASEKKSGPAQPQVYVGNVMYVNADIKNPDEVYALVMVRFINEAEVTEIPVKTFALKKGFNAKVGDLVLFEAVRLRESTDGNTGEPNTME